MERLLTFTLALFHRLHSRRSTILAVLALFTIVGASFAFMGEGRHQRLDPPMTWHEAVLSAVGLFTMSAFRISFPQTRLLEFFCYLAPAISAGALFSAFANLIEQRAPLVGYRRHYVIGGLGTIGTTVARHAARVRRSRFIAIERSEDAHEVGVVRTEGHGAVIIGDMTNEQILRRARVHLAERVFFTSPSDIVNLDAAFHVRRIVRAAGGRHLPQIYAHVYDAGLADSLAHQLTSGKGKDAPIIPFNSFRFASKALVAMMLRDGLVPARRIGHGIALARTPWQGADAREDGDPLEEDRRRLRVAFRLEPESDFTLRYAIVGLGRFGRSVMRELFESLPISTRYLVVEQSRETFDHHADRFTEEQKGRFEACIGDAGAPRVVAAIEAWKPDAVLVCTDDDVVNLRLALDLKGLNVRSVTRMFNLDASRELGRGLVDRGIHPIGLGRLFPAAIPILTHERQLLACLNLDFLEGHGMDHRHRRHLFYLARVNEVDRRELGRSFVALTELDRVGAMPPIPAELGLVWYEHVRLLDLEASPIEPVQATVGALRPPRAEAG